VKSGLSVGVACGEFDVAIKVLALHDHAIALGLQRAVVYLMIAGRTAT